MSRRPLRQFYGQDRVLTIEGLPSPVDAFRRHRHRFVEALAGLGDDEWSATTRCDAWDARDVVNHLVTADGFWSLTIANRGSEAPTTFLRDFDPTSSPGAVIAPLKDRSAADVLDAFRQSTQQLTDALAAVADSDGWHLRSESPFGHVPVAVIAAHSLWDSWLHERDVLLPLGRVPEVADDELVTAAAFTLFVGGAQGGVLDDADAVGEGPDGPLDAAVTFGDDLAGRAIRLGVDRDVRVEVEHRVELGGTVDGGSAVAFVEAVTGRSPMGPVLDGLPADLAAQLHRARQIL